MSNHPQKSGSLCSGMSGSLYPGIGGSLYPGIGGSLYPGILSQVYQRATVGVNKYFLCKVQRTFYQKN